MERAEEEEEEEDCLGGMRGLEWSRVFQQSNSICSSGVFGLHLWLSIYLMHMTQIRLKCYLSKQLQTCHFHSVFSVCTLRLGRERVISVAFSL